jgi:hypothetical protein
LAPPAIVTVYVPVPSNSAVSLELGTIGAFQFEAVLKALVPWVLIHCRVAANAGVVTQIERKTTASETNLRRMSDTRVDGKTGSSAGQKQLRLMGAAIGLLRAPA